MFILYQQVSDTEGLVQTIHNFPDQLPPEIKARGFEVSFIPEVVPQVGKDAALYCNISTHELYYKYVDRPLNSDERIAQLESDLQQRDDVLNFILMTLP